MAKTKAALYKQLTLMCKLQEHESAALLWYAAEGFAVLNKLTGYINGEPMPVDIIYQIQKHLDKKYLTHETVIGIANRYKDIINGGERIRYLGDLIDLSLKSGSIIETLKTRFHLPEDITLYRGLDSTIDKGILLEKKQLISTSVYQERAEDYMSSKEGEPYYINIIKAKQGVPFVAVPVPEGYPYDSEVLLFKDTLNIIEAGTSIQRRKAFNETIVKNVFEVSSV